MLESGEIKLDKAISKKQKVFNSINRVKQDILPTQIDYTPEMKIIIKKLLKVTEKEIEKKLDNHIKYAELNDKTNIDKEKGIQYDNWGVGWDIILTEGFHIRHHPLIESEDVTKFKFPEPKDSIIEIVKEKANKKEDYFLLVLHDFALFERSWLLWGYENVLTSFYFRQKEINYLLDGITEYHLEISKKIVRQNLVDGVHTGDDFGTQRGMVMSPEVWRKFFKKRYSKIWGIYKDKNIPVIHHSCGNIIEIIEDLIEIGLDVLTPIQPEAMDPAELSKKFGKKLSFLGGISTQKTLPFGSPSDVRNEVISRIKTLGKNDGYIISLSHEITTDCKKENFLELIRTLEDYRNGKLII